MSEDLTNLAAELKRRGIPPRYFAEQRRRGMSSEEIMAAWPKRTLSNRVGSRRFRRQIVVGTFGGWLLILAIDELISLAYPKWFVTPIALLVGYFAIQWFWHGRRTYINTPDLADEELDERLVQIKNQAYRTAFRVFAPVALIGGLLSMIAMTLQPGERGMTNAILIYFGIALLATILPTAIVAWREPDPTEPDEMPA